jgi:phage terminase large subunit-like protein
LKVFFMDGSDISIITYEQGYNRVEAVMVDLALIDEEPPDRRFFTGVVEHAKQISMQFTPLNGMTWAYEDILLKAKGNDSIRIFTATQFDSPYQIKEHVVSKLSLYKPWEVESKVFGVFSEQKGKPYFDREKLNIWANTLVETFERKKFEPLAAWTTALELNRIRVRALDADEDGEGVWRVYEPKVDGLAYFVSIDTALGTEDADQGEVGDYNAAVIRRMPIGDETRPVDVAAYWTQGRVIPFARDCLAAARYWNNALLCPEVRGESAGVFMNEVVGYPFILKTTVVNDMTRKTMDKQGFYTTGKTRKEAFDLLADLIDNSKTNPGIRIRRVLHEAAQCVKGKSGRPDHERRDHDDVLFAYAISEWVYRYAREQVKFRADKALTGENVRLPRWQLDKQEETRPILGSHRGMDTRHRERIAGNMPPSRRFI